MEYSEEFKDLVDKCCKSDNKYLKFIGLGNPNSDILIIGKEEACYDGSDGVINENGLSFANARLWRENYLHNCQPDDVEDWKMPTEPYYDGRRFNPLFPFKNDQKNKIRRKDKDNGGTSCTWKWYQCLLSEFYDECAISSEEQINFHQYAFISELSSIPFHSSPRRMVPEIKESIDVRCREIFSHEFFMHFNKIVVACGDYVRKYGSKESNMLCDTFKVNINDECLAKCEYADDCVHGKDCRDVENMRGSNLYPYSSDDRVLVHSRQLSNSGVGGRFIKRLACYLKAQKR